MGAPLKVITIDYAAVLRYVRAHPGALCLHIAEGLGLPPGHVRVALQELVSLGLLATTGNTRATAYHAGPESRNDHDRQHTRKRNSRH